jgi:hypothetical protein
VSHACNPSYSGDREQKNLSSQTAQANSCQNPISKIPNINKKAGRVVQVVKRLPHKCEALSSSLIPPPEKSKLKVEFNLEKSFLLSITPAY